MGASVRAGRVASLLSLPAVTGGSKITRVDLNSLRRLAGARVLENNFLHQFIQRTFPLRERSQ